MHPKSIITLVLVALLVGCGTEEYFLSSGAIMGTTYSVKVVLDKKLTAEQEKALSQAIVAPLVSIDNELSTYKPSSALSRFNKAPVLTEIRLSEESFEVLRRSREVMERTMGYFDPSIGPLVSAWGFGADASDIPPSRAEVNSLLSQSGMKHVELLMDKRALRKTGETYLDLSAIAKGYSTDLVALRIQELGYKNFLVEIGGEVYASGKNIEDEVWRLGIEAPDFAGRKAYTVVGLSNASMATSGDYRNFINGANGRYSHTINPKTGFPVKADIASVSVVEEHCAEADALATALMAMGADLALDYANTEGLAAFFIIRKDNGLVATHSRAFEPYLTGRL